MPTNVGFTSAVECNGPDNEPIDFIYQWEDFSNTNLIWTVRDGLGTIYFQGTDNVIANNCLSLGLSMKYLLFC